MVKYLISAIFLAVCGVLPAAHIGFMMPAGGKQGSTVEIIIGGQSFGGCKEAWISGKGVTIESVRAIPGLPNMDSKQRRYVSLVLRNYHANKPNNIPVPEDQEGWRKHDFYNRLYDLTDCERDILYRFMFVPRNSLQSSPAISQRAIVRLKIAPDAPVGVREFRLIARNGIMSNPLKFVIGSAAEYREGFFPYPPAKQIMPEITVPSAINGQITPGECDRYNFKAVKGQVITFKLRGRFFNPFIGDGVPGHFQPVLEVFDSQNKSLAFADDHYFDPDPVLTFKAPADGIYTLAVRDAIYRGREDFVYRVEVLKGALPLPDAAAPKIANVPLVDFSKDLSVKAVSARELAQYPVIVTDELLNPNGNTYALQLKKDEELLLEVFARRLALPPDTVIKVYDQNRKLLAFNDDVERFKAGTILHNTADSLLCFKAPADGLYYIEVSDVAGAFGAAYKYFLRIDRKRVRFAVYAVPSSLRGVNGTANVVKLQVERFDQFNGAIKLKVKSPKNFRIIGSDIIPTNCNSTVITLDVPFDKDKKVQLLELEASAGDFKTTVIAGNEATQAFAYTHINPAEYFTVRVNHKSRGMYWKNNPAALKLSADKPVIIKTRASGWFPPNIELKLVPVDLPKWVKVVPNKKSKMKTVTVKKPRRKAYIVVPEMEYTLQSTPEGAGKAANVLFKVVWTEKSRPDKNGKVHTYTRELDLPVIRLEGGKI